MHIKTRCPRCENTYQVDPGLKGKRMRCPNTLCRAVFEVQDVAQAPASPVQPSPPAPTPVRSGKVGDIVPMLPAEAAAPVAPPEVFRAPEPAPAPSEPTLQQRAAIDDFLAGARPVSSGEPGP